MKEYERRIVFTAYGEIQDDIAQEPSFRLIAVIPRQHPFYDVVLVFEREIEP